MLFRQRAAQSGATQAYHITGLGRRNPQPPEAMVMTVAKF